MFASVGRFRERNRDFKTLNTALKNVCELRDVMTLSKSKIEN
jgi:hypothetical protein